MGGRHFCLFWGVLLGWGEPAGAADFDACQNNCRLGRDHTDSTAVFCSCEHARGGLVSPHALAGGEWGQRVRLRGVSEADAEVVGEDQCRARVAELRAHPRPVGGLAFYAESGSVPICDCVAARVHFPVVRQCRHTGGGENACSFALGSREASSTGPLRDPALEDYQQCLAQEANHASAINRCDVASCEPPPRCRPGQELVNEAASGDCCPKLVCRPKPERIRTGGGHEGVAQ